MALMTTYKPGQGKQARTFAALIYVFVVAWGCFAFMEYGNSKLDRLAGRIFSYEQPVFGQPLQVLFGGSAAEVSGMTAWVTLSFVVSVALFFVLLFIGRKLLNRAKVADHLIGTELELRRVTWPSKSEVARSGTVVVYYTFWLALIIFAIDLIMNTFVGMLLGQSFENVGLGRIFSGISEFFTGAES